MSSAKLGAMETGYQRGKIQEESLYYEPEASRDRERQRHAAALADRLEFLSTTSSTRSVSSSMMKLPWFGSRSWRGTHYKRRSRYSRAVQSISQRKPPTSGESIVRRAGKLSGKNSR
jgi:hypothetical protein